MLISKKLGGGGGDETRISVRKVLRIQFMLRILSFIRFHFIQSNIPSIARSIINKCNGTNKVSRDTEKYLFIRESLNGA